jgi:hypothetical protein
MKYNVSLVSTIRGLLLPLEGAYHPSWVSVRSSRWAYLAYAPLRLQSCRSWGKRQVGKKPSLMSPTVPSRSMHTLVRDNPSEITEITPLVAARLLAWASLLLRGLGRREGHGFTLCPACTPSSVPAPTSRTYSFLLPHFLMSPVLRRLFSNTCPIVLCPSVPSPNGPPIRVVCYCDNPKRIV